MAVCAENEESVEEFDFIILGTGLTETAVGSLLAQRGQRVLQIDTGASYGSEFATLRYSQLAAHFGTRPCPALLEKDRAFNIDLTPKLLLHDSPLKDFLVEQSIHELVTFGAIEGSFIHSDRQHAVPRNEAQALKSGAVGFFQKPRIIRFFWHVRSFFDGKTPALCATMREEFNRFKLSEDAVDFIGHAIALHLDDGYLDAPPQATYDRIVRYVSSVVGFSGTESPYLYPHYGLSEICQAFARRAALAGATFMLGAEILSCELGGAQLKGSSTVECVADLGGSCGDSHLQAGEACSSAATALESSRSESLKAGAARIRVRGPDGVERSFGARMLIASPYILMEMKKRSVCSDSPVHLRAVGDAVANLRVGSSQGSDLVSGELQTPFKVLKRIIRGIAILKSAGQRSRSIVFLRRQLNRQHDVFCVILGAAEMACPSEYEIAILTTVQETEDIHTELLPVLRHFSVVEHFEETRAIYESVDGPNVIYTRGVDESPLMDSLYDDVLRILRRCEEPQLSSVNAAT